MATPSALVLNHGGIKSLLTTAMAAAQPNAVMLYIHDGHPADPMRHKHFLQQADHYKIPRRLEINLTHLTIPNLAQPAQPRRAPLSTAQRLLAAASLGAQIRAAHLIWPAQVGDNFEATASATELILTIGQMLSVVEGLRIPIEVPLLEMTGRQIIEVGQQMQIPWQLAWDCLTAAEKPCGQCHGCKQRAQWFGESGIADPLDAEANR